MQPLYAPLINEALRYHRWDRATPAEPIPREVALEGAGSELRTPLFHYGTVMPVYLALARYLAREKSLKGKRLVELGSGSGRALAYIKSLFPELTVVGTDYSAECIAYSKRVYGMYGIAFVHTPAQKTVLSSHSFDYVLSSHVIEHIPRSDGPVFIKEVRRLLKRGGSAYIGTPERRMSQNKYAQNPRDEPSLRLVPPHEHEYTLGELKQLAGKHARVDKLANPLFRQIFLKSIARFRPGTSLSLVYRGVRDFLPKSVFDTMTRVGSYLQLRVQHITFRDILLAHTLTREQSRGYADTLLLVIKP